MKHLKIILCVLLGVMLISTSIVAEQQVLKKKQVLKKRPFLMPIVKVKLEGPDKPYTGVCPANVRFKGTIKSIGPVKLYYHFVRSDGVSSRRTPLIIGTRAKDYQKTITYTWRIYKDYQGSVQLIAKVGTREFKSKWVGFMVDCDERKPLKPQLKKFNWKLVKIPAKRKILKISEAKFQLVTPLDVPVDLATTEANALPPKIPYYRPILIKAKFRNYGKKTSPSCVMSVTLKSSKKSPKTGKDTFKFEFKFPPLGSGYERKWNFPFYNFWPCDWTVTVKVDSRNWIKEGIKEINNTANSSFEVK